VEQRQAERVRALRKGRDAAAAERSLAALRTAAKGKDNLVPLIYEAVKAYATLGEIGDAFREAWGEHRETVVL
jgi:methylmalonyl-CoA mutase N-terminal domain/subunit